MPDSEATQSRCLVHNRGFLPNVGLFSGDVHRVEVHGQAIVDLIVCHKRGEKPQTIEKASILLSHLLVSTARVSR